MRFSLYSNFDRLPGKPVAELYRAVEAQAITADRLGFDAIYLTEPQVARDGYLPDALFSLARLSGLTQQIGLGTAISATDNPLRLAEDAALLDQLSGGRLRLAVGAGGYSLPDARAYCDSLRDEQPARAIELAAILHQAFDEGVVYYAGRYYHYKGTQIASRPQQSARNLLWLAASDATVEAAGCLGYRLVMPRAITTEGYQMLYQRYRVALAGQPGGIAQHRFVFVAETEREAQAQTRLLIQRYAKHELGIVWDGRSNTSEYRDILRGLNAVIGTPAQVIGELLVDQYERDYDEVICQTYAAGMRHDDALRAIELLGSAVLPQLQTNDILRARAA